MSQFNVGQRVRIVFADDMGGAPLQGREATVSRIPSACVGGCCDVLVDGYDARVDGYVAAEVAIARWGDLAPLTDPQSDAFLATVRSWGPLPMPTIEEQLQESILMVRGGSQ